MDARDEEIAELRRLLEEACQLKDHWKSLADDWRAMYWGLKERLEANVLGDTTKP